MNEKHIWERLIQAGMTEAGAAGLMGNLRAESNLEPRNLQNTYERKLGHTDDSYTVAVDNRTYKNFATDAAGYGLAQWTFRTRKAALLEFARAQGKSIGDLDMQIDFLIKELRESYQIVWNVLTTTTSVRGASDDVLLKYERPADTSDRVRSVRAGFGEQYFQKFRGTAPAPEQPGTITGTLEINGKKYSVVLTEI